MNKVEQQNAAAHRSCRISRQKKWLTLSIMALTAAYGYGGAPARDLRVGEGFRDPIGFHDATPTFSWTLPAGVSKQSAYRIQAKGGVGLWDSGWVESDQSVLVPYGGTPLQSKQRLDWRVRYTDEAGRDSGWSQLASLEMGLLSSKDWKAQWIRLDEPQAELEQKQGKIVIMDAVYGALGDPARRRDVTEIMRKRVAGGAQEITVANVTFGGDPAHGTAKRLRLSYTVDGQAQQHVVNENSLFNLVTGTTLQPKGAGYVPQYFRREFQTGGTIKSARLYVTAKGLYEVWLNGAKVGEDVFVPGYTSYDHRIETLTYDVTAAVKLGDNALGVVLGEGWYAGRVHGRKAKYPELKPALLLQLEITYADGTVETVVSDQRWVGTNQGPIRSSGIYDGETYDARREMPGWNRVGFDDTQWRRDLTVELLTETPILHPKGHAPVRATGELPARSVSEPVPGRFVFDLGQNMVGWARVTMPVEQGQPVTMRFAEMLEKDGTLYTANYRNAKSTDTYTAAETGTVTWSPTFTFHGFRYVELSGLPEGAKPEANWVTGVVLHSAMRRIGRFQSSHEKLNQLQSNIVWGQRGNFLDIPTDCPQRNERLGWTGDAQAFAPTALFNYDSHAFFKSWLQTMRGDQLGDGRIPNVVPKPGLGAGSPGWQDAATIVPWAVYVRTGDREILADNFEMMEGLVRWYRNHATDNRIHHIGGFGDWLQPYAEKLQGDTEKPLLGTAFYALGADILAKSARVLGRDDAATRYAEEAATVKEAFTQHYFDADGKLKNTRETQTAYLLAIAFEMIPEALAEKAAHHLARQIHAADGHLRTGFLGTPFIASVLDNVGRTDLAYSLLFKETYPSWFFSINQGATTMWERWNSYSHKDGFGEAGMNSFNHYAYGAIGQWMYERIAGLTPDPEHPGYKHFYIQPFPGEPLRSAAAELDTPYGLARSAWERKGEQLTLAVTVPPNTTATIFVPANDADSVLESGQAAAKANGVKFLRLEEGQVVFDLSSGHYTFVSTVGMLR